jgi:hypothetical protein
LPISPEQNFRNVVPFLAWNRRNNPPIGTFGVGIAAVTVIARQLEGV